MLSAAIAVGVASGLLEMGILFAQVRGLHVVDWSTLMISRHAAWMVPATGAGLDVLLAMILVAPMLILAARRVRKRPEDDAPGPAWEWAGMVLGTLLLLGPLLAVRGFHPVAPLAVSVGAGYRIRRWIVRPTLPWRRGVHGAAAIAIGVLALLMVSQSHAGRSISGLVAARPDPRRPNLLWIVLDTLRADRMSVYGYARPTTPSLESWAKAGITFDMARSTAPWTLPSHVSMFTGLLPSEHGACIDQPYRGTSPTLAEHLRAHGYDTAGVVANVRMCNTAYGVGRGFDHYRDYPCREEISFKAAMSNSSLGAMLMEGARRLCLPVPAVYPFDFKQPASEIIARGRGWLDSRGAGGSPFFLFLNFVDVHGPYVPAAEAMGRFWHGPPPNKTNAGPGEGWRAAQARDAAVPSQRPRRQAELDAVTRRLGDLYDECLLGVDAELGRFLAGLRDAGMLANTWVVITSDHGEHFGEHGHFGHGSTLYNEQTHVPLILIPPLGGQRPERGDPHADLRGRRVGVPVSLRDLPATMTEALIPGSTNPFPGRSLARHWRAAGAETPDPVLSELDEPRLKGEDFRTEDVARLESVIDEDHILIDSSRRPTELFALFDDPRQERNLADRADEAPLRRRLRKVLDDLHHRPGTGSGLE
jgi:arylsulfatase A-like enzyme